MGRAPIGVYLAEVNLIFRIGRQIYKVRIVFVFVQNRKSVGIQNLVIAEFILDRMSISVGNGGLVNVFRIELHLFIGIILRPNLHIILSYIGIKISCFIRQRLAIRLIL